MVMLQNHKVLQLASKSGGRIEKETTGDWSGQIPFKDSFRFFKSIKEIKRLMIYYWLFFMKASILISGFYIPERPADVIAYDLFLKRFIQQLNINSQSVTTIQMVVEKLCNNIFKNHLLITCLFVMEFSGSRTESLSELFHLSFLESCQPLKKKLIKQYF